MLLSEFSPSMPTSLLALLITLGSILRSRLDLQLEILALRHQIGVLERSVHKRPRLTSTDRLLWVSLSGFWRHWRSALLIVKPETVVAWHRKGFRLFWSWKVRHGQQGRPAISRQTRDLIRRMCRENPTLEKRIASTARLQMPIFTRPPFRARCSAPAKGDDGLCGSRQPDSDPVGEWY